jgi:hypothetical protein
LPFPNLFSFLPSVTTSDRKEKTMTALTSPRHVFKAYTTHQPDGTFSAHVLHTIEGRPDIKEKIHDIGIAGTEQEALDEAHAFVARYVAEHPDE